MPYPRGAVVTAGDPFGDTNRRPYLVLSTGRHPFRDEECIAAVVTTTAREGAVELGESAFVRGALPRRSYASPWNPVTLKDAVIEKHVATVESELVDDVAEAVCSYIQ